MRSQDPNCWELDLNTSANPQALPGFTSLRELADNIRDKFQTSGRLKPDNEWLAQLNLIYGQTVEAVCKLHAQRQLAGLLDPDHIYYFRDEQGRERVVLPDLGFTWTDDIPPGPPLVTGHADWSWLWNPEPSDQFLKRPFSEEACRQDLKVLAAHRLLGPGWRAAGGPLAAAPGGDCRRTRARQRCGREGRQEGSEEGGQVGNPPRPLLADPVPGPRSARDAVEIGGTAADSLGGGVPGIPRDAAP